MNYTDRVEGFQICDPTYIGLPPKGTPPQYDIVKWEQHSPIEAVDWETRKKTCIYKLGVMAYLVLQKNL